MDNNVKKGENVKLNFGLFSLGVLLSASTVFAGDVTVRQKKLEGGDQVLIVTPDDRGDFVHYEVSCQGVKGPKVVARIFECSNMELFQVVIISDGRKERIPMGIMSTTKCAEEAIKLTREFRAE